MNAARKSLLKSENKNSASVRFISRLVGFTKVVKTKDKLTIESEFTKKSLALRWLALLFFFASGSLALFLSGLSHALLYYGIFVWACILAFIVLYTISFPELTFSRLLGYTVKQSVNMPDKGRYLWSITVIKKSEGMFMSKTIVNTRDNRGKSYNYGVEPSGFINYEKSSAPGSKLANVMFKMNNFLWMLAPISMLVMGIISLVFSFFPFINLLIVLVGIIVFVRYFKVKWKSDKLWGKIIVMISFCIFVVSIFLAISIYFVVFIK